MNAAYAGLLCALSAQATSFSRIVVDDLPITIYDSNLSNPILLNVPGNGGWNYLSPKMGERLHLFDKFTVATYDMRGMPDDTTPPDSWETHVDDVIAITYALRRKYKVPKICILGYSTGTYVVLRAATIVPDAYRAVLTMGLIPNLKDEKASADLQESLWTNLRVPSWLSKAVGYVNYTPWLIQMGSANEMKANVGLQKMMSISVRDVGPIDPIGNSRMSNSMTALSMPDVDLKAVVLTCPLYIIQGDGDTMGLKSAVEEQSTWIRATEVNIFWVEGAGHMVHLTNTDDVARLFSIIRLRIAHQRSAS